MPDDTKAILDVAAAAAQTATTAQIAAERAAEECRVMMEKIKGYEARRPIIKETLREVGTAVDLAPVNDRLARLEAIERKVAEIDAKPKPLIPADSRIDDLLRRIAVLETEQNTVSGPSVDAVRIDRLERQLADLDSKVGTVPRKDGSSTDCDIHDRMAALEELVVQTVEVPNALARQLQMTADLMHAMDERRQIDTALLTEASAMTASAQGGLAAVVEAMKIDIEDLMHAMDAMKSERTRRDSYVASIIKRRGAA